MLRFALLATLACVALSLPTDIKQEENKIDSTLKFKPLDALEQLWKEFKAKHGKAYEEHEEPKRKDIFKANVKKIDFHNYLFQKGYKSYELGLNEYADMEHKEFIAIMNGYKMKDLGASASGSAYLPPLVQVALPDAVDWRTKGYVTEVKNQGQCGSCWSFSTTGSLEGQHFRRTGKLVSLSEQNLVDCSTDYGNNGCNGGLMDNAFKYIRDNRGIDTEESYPYEAKDDTCHFKRSDVGATDTGFVDIPSGNETALTEALAMIGPISVAIDAGHPSFQLYKSGVYNEPECSSTQLDHGVLCVGYGTDENGGDFYWVKNSWGETWGQKGYIKMTRNKDNQCGIATTASYPLV